MGQISFDIVSREGQVSKTFSFDHVYVIGYAGRDMDKTMEHIVELEEQLGVAPPKRIPTIFECSHEQLTQSSDIRFVGSNTCGEIEPVIIYQSGELYIGIGSDHTDRKLESVSVLKSKQICAKPIGQTVWKYAEIKPHWDQIELESSQQLDGETVVYQSGLVSDILPLEKIVGELMERVEPFENAVIFCGTVPLKDGFKYGERFTGTMHDPVLNRSIAVDYRISIIPEEER